MSDIIGWSEKYLDDYRSLNLGTWLVCMIGFWWITICWVAGLRLIMMITKLIVGLLLIEEVEMLVWGSLNPKLIESDKAAVVNWINLGNFWDSDVGTILSDIDVLRTANCGMSFSHIPPQANRAALSLVKYALRSANDRFWMEDCPVCIRSIVEKEKPG
ncbi:hypothetical protein LWI29_033926 [Acer saccharum]|uniref:RNase H type-1 domain-containing protein n=1 Tax=Acer saccharum TaxID=4024 RepID=A0AA39SXV8_ACESA|nr:hypothetical protein LWI29_033926 [Acer saccharum]